jgi:hypothetical protein
MVPELSMAAATIPWAALEAPAFSVPVASASSKASIFGNVQIDISILKEIETKGIIYISRFYSTSFINA